MLKKISNISLILKCTIALFTLLMLINITIVNGQITLVKDIRSGIMGSSPNYFIDFSGTLFFSADDGINGRELWKSDGTTIGTIMVKDIFPGSSSSNSAQSCTTPNVINKMSGFVYFGANDGVHGYELWRSDGTLNGTQLFADLLPQDQFGNNSPSCPNNLTSIINSNNNLLFFSAQIYGYPTTRYSFKTDGNSLMFTIDTALSQYHPVDFDNFINLNGSILCRSSYSGISNLYNYNAPLSNLSNIKPDFVQDFTSIKILRKVGDEVFFKANGAYNTVPYAGFGGLWKTNSSKYGTLPVKRWISIDENRGTADIDNKFYFIGGSSNTLYESDGTDAGTKVVSNSLTSCDLLTVVNNVMYFKGYNSATGWELWRSDGSELGTYMIKDIFTGSNSSNPSKLIGANGLLYFLANDGVHGSELWRSDGTPNGTFIVQDFNPSGSFTINNICQSGNKLFFDGSSSSSGVGSELYMLNIQKPSQVFFNNQLPNAPLICIRPTIPS